MFKGDNLLVIGGYNGSFLSDVEIIRFSNENEKCEPFDLDYLLYGHASVATSKGVITCGGTRLYNTENRIKIISKCILQTSKGQTSFPSMAQNRSRFQMVQVEGIIYAIGGIDEDTMETISIETGKQWKKESLPFKVYNHCVVNIDKTIIVIGGFDDQKMKVR